MLLVLSHTSYISSKDFHIIPAPNPDGYEYTWDSDRLWYKNRQIVGPYTKCLGLDMNRYVISYYLAEQITEYNRLPHRNWASYISTLYTFDPNLSVGL